MEKKPLPIFAITFTNSDFAPNHVPLVPTQIYASVLDFAHYFVLILAAKHLKERGQRGWVCIRSFTVWGVLSWNFTEEIWKGEM